MRKVHFEPRLNPVGPAERSLSIGRLHEGSLAMSVLWQDRAGSEC